MAVADAWITVAPCGITQCHLVCTALTSFLSYSFIIISLGCMHPCVYEFRIALVIKRRISILL